jgi:hypothetical protein
MDDFFTSKEQDITDEPNLDSSEWREYYKFSDSLQPVSSVSFDLTEELLWIGHEDVMRISNFLNSRDPRGK